MNTRELLLEEISAFNLPAYSEIPNVGLFLEQVTKYITEYMQPIESVSLTGSMISNYVKKNIVKNPVRKQYDRNQIATLIFISMAKTVLSLEDIQLLLQMIPENYDGEKSYETFRSAIMNTLNVVFDGGSVDESDDKGESPEEQLLKHTVTTIAHKIYLDKYFKTVRALEGKEEATESEE